MDRFAVWSRLALVALGSCVLATGTPARADGPIPGPAAGPSVSGGSVPPGWVWQGTWQDGRWNGQWIAGPGIQGPGIQGPGIQGPGIPGGYPVPPPGAAPWGGDPSAQRMAERCRPDGNAAPADGEHRRDRDCEMVFGRHPGFGPGYPAGPQMPAYGPFPYGPVPYAPMGYMMVPVVTVQQPPVVETRTITRTEYVTVHRHRVACAKPRHHDKRVHTGS